MHRGVPHKNAVPAAGGFFAPPVTAGRGGYVGGFDAPGRTQFTGGGPGRNSTTPQVPGLGIDDQDPEELRQLGEYQRDMLGERVHSMFALPGQEAPITTGQARLGAQRHAMDAWEEERQLFNRMEERMMTPDRHYDVMGNLLDANIQGADRFRDEQLAMAGQRNALETRRGLEELRAGAGAAGRSALNVEEEMLRQQMGARGAAEALGINVESQQMLQGARGEAAELAGKAGQAIGTEAANAAQWLLSQSPGAPPSDVLTATISDAEARNYIPGTNYLPEKTISTNRTEAMPAGGGMAEHDLSAGISLPNWDPQSVEAGEMFRQWGRGGGDRVNQTINQYPAGSPEHTQAIQAVELGMRNGYNMEEILEALNTGNFANIMQPRPRLAGEIEEGLNVPEARNEGLVVRGG